MTRSGRNNHSGQKWQVAGASAADASEDDHASTRIPSSGGASPSASSSELRSAAPWLCQDGRKTGGPLTKKELEERARWADVESDHEDSGHRQKGDERSSGKKGKGYGKGKSEKAAQPPAPPPPREDPRPVVKQPEPYRPSKGASRYASSYNDSYGWEEDGWGASAGGWASGKYGGSSWDDSSWNQKSQASSGYKSYGGGGKGGGKVKNESFKNGPQVSVNMDRSRLAW